MRGALRRISLLLILAFTWNGLAHAAKPSTKLARLEAATAAEGAPRAASTPPATQATTPTPGASAHDRLLAAHTVFLSAPTTDPNFVADPTATYNAVLDALNQWGRYRLVNSSDGADLILQIHGRVTEVDTPGTPPDYTPSVSFYSNLDLTLAEPGSLSPVWKVSIPVLAGRRKPRTSALTLAGENAVSSLKITAGDPLTAHDKAALKTAHSSNTRALIFGAAGVGLLIGFAVLGVHLLHNNARNFCQQNNISPCPGA